MKTIKKLRLIFLFFCLLQDLHAAEINIYQYTQAGMLSPSVKNALYRVYVPNGRSGTVSVIDPTIYKVIDTFRTGKQPQHVVPSYDLQTLSVLNNKSNSVTQINPATGKPEKTIPVNDPYNLYYTPDGKFAIVVCESRKQLEFRDPKTLALKNVLPVQCRGANHMDFTQDGQYAIVTCEYVGQLMKIDLVNNKVLSYLSLNPNQDPKNYITPTPNTLQIFPKNADMTHEHEHEMNNTSHKNSMTRKKMKSKLMSMPQDIRSSADGKIFFVADMVQGGLVLIDPIRFTQIGFIPTGVGTHGIYPSRDGKLFYVSNRGCPRMLCGPHGLGSVSVVDPVKKKVLATWQIPLGGSPDMGNVTADGKELWLSGRFDNEVYVFDTTSGQLTHRIPVGKGPHGLAVWPQPGRYSLGHTGNMR